MKMPRYNGRTKYYKRLQLFLRFRRVAGERAVNRKVVYYDTWSRG